MFEVYEEGGGAAGPADHRRGPSSSSSSSSAPACQARQVKKGGWKRGDGLIFTKHGNQQFADIVWFTCPSPSV